MNRMMNHALKPPVLSLLLFAAIACTSSHDHSPKRTTECYIEALQARDWATMIDQIHLTGDSATIQQSKERLLLGLDTSQKEILKQNNGIESYTITNETISDNGESAEVEVVILYGNGSTQKAKMALINVDGHWMLGSK